MARHNGLPARAAKPPLPRCCPPRGRERAPTSSAGRSRRGGSSRAASRRRAGTARSACWRCPPSCLAPVEREKTGWRQGEAWVGGTLQGAVQAAGSPLRRLPLAQPAQPACMGVHAACMGGAGSVTAAYQAPGHFRRRHCMRAHLVQVGLLDGAAALWAPQPAARAAAGGGAQVRMAKPITPRLACLRRLNQRRNTCRSTTGAQHVCHLRRSLRGVLRS